MNSTLWGVIALLAVAGGLIFWSNSMKPSYAPVTGDAATLLAVAADDHTKGAAAGQAVLVEYLDFECPACASYVPIVAQMEQEFGDRVTFVTRYFPLSGHRNGLSSAVAVEAAGKQGKYAEMFDLLYARQKEWGGKQVVTPQVFEAYAAELGLNLDTFKADVASDEVMARVMRDKNAGEALGVAGTPSFFLNGKKIENPQSLEEFRAALDAAIAANGA